MAVAGQCGVIMRVMIPGRIPFPLTSGSTSGFVRLIVEIIYLLKFKKDLHLVRFILAL